MDLASITAEKDEQIGKIAQIFERGEVATLQRTSGDTQARRNVLTDPRDRRLVIRPGRILADGTRRGAKVVRRINAEISPEVGEALDEYAQATRKTIGEVIESALEKMGIQSGVTFLSMDSRKERSNRRGDAEAETPVRETPSRATPSRTGNRRGGITAKKTPKRRKKTVSRSPR
jgi:hypothetical protein